MNRLQPYHFSPSPSTGISCFSACEALTDGRHGDSMELEGRFMLGRSRTFLLVKDFLSYSSLKCLCSVSARPSAVVGYNLSDGDARFNISFPTFEVEWRVFISFREVRSTTWKTIYLMLRSLCHCDVSSPLFVIINSTITLTRSIT